MYINRTSSFLPNDPISNDEIEEVIGQIGGNASKAKNLILKKNQIKTRYYSLNKKGHAVYSNAEMAALAIKQLFSKEFTPGQLELLACGTSSPDQMMPSHASMVHGLLPETGYLQIMSPSGVCASAMQGLYACFNAIKAGSVKYAITSGSELASTTFRADFFETEYNKLAELMNKPRIAFEEDFLRFMLSDGAGAFLLSDQLTKGLNYEVNWIESFSFAEESWYVPLPDIGNIGSASIYAALDRLQRDRHLKSNQKVLLFIPESSRFNFFYILLTVKIVD